MMWVLEPLLRVELNEGDRLFHVAEHLSNCDLSECSIDHEFDQTKLPITLAVIDQDFVFQFITETGSSELSVSVGSDLVDSRAELVVQDRIRLYRESVDCHASEIPFPEEQKVVLLAPLYVFECNALSLARVVLVSVSDQRQQFTSTTKLFHDLFYRIFPHVIQNAQLPEFTPASLKTTHLIIVRLLEFDRWVETVPPEVVGRFRREVSDAVMEKCMEDTIFLRVLEHTDTIVLRVNRELSSSLFWCINETCLDFLNGLFRDLSVIAQRYSAPVMTRALVFRCSDPAWYAPEQRMARLDCFGDSALLALALEQSGDVSCVNYVSQKKEMHAKNTAKVRNCCTADGAMFELYLFV
jgi:hypothetical protein